MDNDMKTCEISSQIGFFLSTDLHRFLDQLIVIKRNRKKIALFLKISCSGHANHLQNQRKTVAMVQTSERPSLRFDSVGSILSPSENVTTGSMFCQNSRLVLTNSHAFNDTYNRPVYKILALLEQRQLRYIKIVNSVECSVNINPLPLPLT